VCHTYCTQTYVLAAKKSQCTGMKKKQIISDVRAMQIKKTEKACKEILKIYICHEHKKNSFLNHIHNMFTNLSSVTHSKVQPYIHIKIS
jgi:hypothetical protein